MNASSSATNLYLVNYEWVSDSCSGWRSFQKDRSRQWARHDYSQTHRQCWEGISFIIWVSSSNNCCQGFFIIWIMNYDSKNLPEICYPCTWADVWHILVTDYDLLKGMLSTEHRSTGWAVLFRMWSPNQHRQEEGSLTSQYRSLCKKVVPRSVCVEILLLASSALKRDEKSILYVSPYRENYFSRTFFVSFLEKETNYTHVCLIIQCANASGSSFKIIICQ